MELYGGVSHANQKKKKHLFLSNPLSAEQVEDGWLLHDLAMSSSTVADNYFSLSG